MVIAIAVVIALVLIWGGILAFLKWVQPIEEKHILALGGYVSIISAALIYLVLQTSLTQQEKALESTQTRLNQELNVFRDKLGLQTERIMAQLNEKAELTQSEMEIRGHLQTERAEHSRTRDELAKTQKQLQNTQTQRDKEVAAHQAYLDSLNTERALHTTTRKQLEEEKQNLSVAKRDLQTAQSNLQQAQQNHQQTQQDLRQTRQELDQTRQTLTQSKEQLAAKTATADNLQTQLQQAKSSVESALKQELSQQQNTLNTLQTAVDSIYTKVLNKPRN